MSDWLPNSLLYEINTWVWLRDLSTATGRKIALGNVPEKEWDRVAELGVGAVWLMGVWERSPAGRKLALRQRGLMRSLRQTMPDITVDDVIGSPYCIRRYQVDPELGGRAGLAAAREALGQRGIRLLLDFVPNHVAPDHPWVSAHPNWFIRGSDFDLARAPGAFVKLGAEVFARARDPYFPSWSDVLQLDAFNLEQRRAMVSELRSIADQCDGVRCDMAMLLLNQVFARTWGKRAPVTPAADYWTELITGVRSSHPQFRFLAEGYWNLENTLLEQGFDSCYDKGLYDQLAHGSAISIREHLVRQRARQERLVRFLENHDEPRATQVFPWPKLRAAMIVWLTLPGVHLLHEGQLEGRTVRTPLHVGRRPGEAPDARLVEEYARMLRLGTEPVFHSGRWTLCDTAGWPDNSSHTQLLAWHWQQGSKRLLIVVNYSNQGAQGRVRIPSLEVAGKEWRLIDALDDAVYLRSGDELTTQGLFVDLQAWACHVLGFQECLLS